MDFLPDDYSYNDYASMFTLEKLETMIRCSSLQNKSELINKLQSLNESEALEMIGYIKVYMPRMGTEAIPQNVKEQGEAIRNAVEKDDFYESRYKK